jgi:hypothetical protein
MAMCVLEGSLLLSSYAYIWNIELHRHVQYHIGKIEEKSPGALDWLDENHPYIWTRSKFLEDSMVDYINNNLSECFNS